MSYVSGLTRGAGELAGFVVASYDGPAVARTSQKIAQLLITATIDLDYGDTGLVKWARITGKTTREISPAFLENATARERVAISIGNASAVSLDSEYFAAMPGVVLTRRVADAGAGVVSQIGEKVADAGEAIPNWLREMFPDVSKTFLIVASVVVGLILLILAAWVIGNIFVAKQVAGAVVETVS